MKFCIFERYFKNVYKIKEFVLKLHWYWIFSFENSTKLQNISQGKNVRKNSFQIIRLFYKFFKFPCYLNPYRQILYKNWIKPWEQSKGMKGLLGKTWGFSCGFQWDFLHFSPGVSINCMKSFEKYKTKCK